MLPAQKKEEKKNNCIFAILPIPFRLFHCLLVSKLYSFSESTRSKPKIVSSRKEIGTHGRTSCRQGKVKRTGKAKGLVHRYYLIN